MRQMVFSKRKNKQKTNSDRIMPHSMPNYSYHGTLDNKGSDKKRDRSKNIVRKLKPTKKLFLEKFGLIILAIVIVVSLISTLYLSNNSVVILEKGSNNQQLYQNYQPYVKTEADKLLASSIFNSSKLTINTSKITSTLEADFPMYSSISVNLPFISHRPTIYLIPAEVAIEVNSPSGQYLVSNEGKVMLKGSSLASFSSLNLPPLSYQGVIPNVGQQILTTNEVKFIQTVVYELSLGGDKITSMSMPQGTSELDVQLTGVSYYIKFNIESNDARRQSGSLLATQRYLKSQNITPSKYIDVRSDGRVYYL